MAQDETMHMNLQYFAEQPEDDKPTEPQTDPEKKETEGTDDKEGKTDGKTLNDIVQKALADQKADFDKKFKESQESSAQMLKDLLDKTKNPPKEEKPEEKLSRTVQELKEQLEESKKRDAIREQDEYATEYLKSKSLPSELSTLFLKDKPEDIKETIDNFGKIFDKAVKERITKEVDTTKPGGGKSSAKKDKSNPFEDALKDLQKKLKK